MAMTAQVRFLVWSDFLLCRADIGVVRHVTSRTAAPGTYPGASMLNIGNPVIISIM